MSELSDWISIEIEINGIDSDVVSDAISKINNNFDKKDMIAKVSDDKIMILLNSLDVKIFKEIVLKSNNEILNKVLVRIESIRSFDLKNGKRVFVGYNNEKKVKNRKEKTTSRESYYYANNNNYSKENNIIPPEYVDKIVCGNSLEILKKLPDNCVDIIITSPPYNFGLNYDEHNDTSQWEDYYKILFQIIDEGIRVLKFGGRFIINVQPLYSDYIPSHHIISSHFMQKKMIWKGEIIWEKNNYNCKYCSWGSWKSPASPYLKYTWEFIEVFCKGDLKKDGDKNNIDITADEFKEWVVAKWSIAPERNMKEYNHPAMFPESLVERSLRLFSYKNDIVVDPFNGAGTTTAVAKRMGRHYLGIDISKEYCETAINRTNREQQQSRLSVE